MASGLAFDCWLSLLEVQTFDVRQRESYELLGCSSVWILSLALPYLPCPPHTPPPGRSLLLYVCLCGPCCAHYTMTTMYKCRCRLFWTHAHTHTHTNHTLMLPLHNPLLYFFMLSSGKFSGLREVCG